MQRIFFALKLDDMTKDELRKLQETVRPLTKRGRFVPPELFHLTLQFLGELTEEEVVRLKNVQYHWLKEISSMELKINHLGCFQKRHRWILWAGVKKNPLLDQIASQLQASLSQLGYINHHPFRPHITLAREVRFNSREAQFAYEDMEIPVTSIRVDGFHLMESKRVEGKLQYASLKKINFDDKNQ